MQQPEQPKQPEQPEYRMPWPDPSFDHYQIDIWDDMVYRVKRIIGSTFPKSSYLCRDKGGAWCWQQDLSLAETWETVQNACASLAECLTQHGVIG